MIIAICDDEQAMLNQVENYCKEIAKCRTVVCSFASAEELKYAIEKGLCPDLLILDIEMAGMSGLEFQKYMQKNKMDINVVYLTSHEEMMQEAFGRNVIAFLNKVNYKERLAELIREYEQELSNQILLSYQNEKVMVETAYVLYIQAADKYSEVYFRCPGNADTKLLLSDNTLVKWEKLLPCEQFCRVTRNMIVNYGNIKYMDKNTIHMTDGKVIIVPKGKVRQFRQAYHAYMRKQVVVL